MTGAFAADARVELGRQVDHLVALGYPALLRHTERRFRSLVEDLFALAEADPTLGEGDGGTGSAAFALVVDGVPPRTSMALTRQGAKAGHVDMRPLEPDDFAPLESLAIPAGPYLVAGLDTGRDTLGVSPRDALPRLAEQGRSPLTIAEGIAVITAFPGILRSANCFQMPGSRRADKRIPSLWVTRAGAPRLGWCFEGVPHSWLGIASCSHRVGSPAGSVESRGRPPGSP